MSNGTRQVSEAARRPGAQWRILAHDGERRIELENEGVFDELVIDHWLHLEQMGDREWLLAVGDSPEVAIWISVKDDGAVALKLKIHGPSTLSIPQEE